ncbi:MAG: zinc-ribbon domain-containing protein [Acidaminococcaceae bacterium]|nr:zinc-ribbon domain-containing protein [Acidaminococcaceae bacterium]
MAQFCTQCGSEIKPGSKFCNKCGSPVKEPIKQSQNNINNNKDNTGVNIDKSSFNTSGNQKLVILSLLVVIIGSLSFYFLYWVKTPQYSLNLIREAVKTHNTTAFEKHVDLDNLIGKGFEDSVDFFLKAQRDAGQIRASDMEIASSVTKTLKPNMVAMLKPEILETISEGKRTDKFKNTKALLNQRGYQMGDTSLMDIGLDDKTEVKNISVVSKESGVSIVAITLHNNKKLKNDFDIKIKMNQLENGEWKVKEITNIIQVLAAIKEAEKI